MDQETNLPALQLSINYCKSDEHNKFLDKSVKSHFVIIRDSQLRNMYKTSIFRSDNLSFISHGAFLTGNFLSYKEPGDNLTNFLSDGIGYKTIGFVDNDTPKKVTTAFYKNVWNVDTGFNHQRQALKALRGVNNIGGLHKTGEKVISSGGDILYDIDCDLLAKKKRNPDAFSRIIVKNEKPYNSFTITQKMIKVTAIKQSYADNLYNCEYEKGHLIKSKKITANTLNFVDSPQSPGGDLNKYIVANDKLQSSLFCRVS